MGVSACLLGQRVRYDGESRPHAWIRDELSKHAQLLPFCPETGAGLPTPRPPVKLVRTDDKQIRVQGVDVSGLDVTLLLQQWSATQEPYLQTLDALVFKARSPSCGLGSTPVFDLTREMVTPRGNGVFASWVVANYPHLFVCEDVFLQTKENQARFIAHIQKKTI